VTFTDRVTNFHAQLLCLLTVGRMWSSEPASNPPLSCRDKATLTVPVLIPNLTLAGSKKREWKPPELVGDFAMPRIPSSLLSDLDTRVC
jgi:hypothetical protein